MSIRQIQIKRNLERVVREFLKHGKNPRIRESIKSAGLDHIGSPGTYKPVSGYKQKLDVDKFNDTASMYEDDIAIITAANEEMVGWTNACRSNYLGRFNSVQKLYEKISLDVISLAMAIRSGTSSVLCVSESFNSLENIDLTETTSYVDTTNGQVMLPVSSDDFMVYTIGDGLALVSIDSSKDGTTWERVNSLEGIEPTIEFSQYKGSLYCKYLIRLTSKKPLIDDEVNVVGVDITLPNYNLSPNEVHIRVSDDTKNWRTLLSPSVGNKMSFIPDNPFEWLEIIVKKNAFDEKHVQDSGKIVYLYLPFLSNVVLRAYSYRNNSILQTNDLPISALADKIGMSSIKFIANDITPGDSTIDYSIRFDSGPWNNIENNEQMQICPHTTEDDVIYPAMLVEKANSLYQVAANCVLSENATLYQGYKQFEHQFCISSVANLELSSWNNRTDLVSKYINSSDNTFLGNGLSHKLYFKINVDSAREFKVSDLSIKGESSLSSLNLGLRVHVNRQEMQPKKNNDNTYSFAGILLEGENYINILIDIPDTLPGGRLHIDGTLFQEGLTYCKKMQQTSFESLSYSIPYTDNNYFAVTPDGSLLVNSQPYPYARYLYRFLDINGQFPKSFAIKALLTGDNNTTPIIDDFSVLILPPIGL